MRGMRIVGAGFYRYKKRKVLGALIVPPKPVNIIISSYTYQPDFTLLLLLNCSDGVVVLAGFHRSKDIGSGRQFCRIDTH
jgi:hypothetical protein